MHAAQEPATVQPVVGLLKIEKDHASGLVRALKVINLLQMAQDVVPDPAARQKGSLRGINHGIKRRAKPVSQHLGDDLAVGVEEGDGPVVGMVGARALPLVDEGDEAGALTASQRMRGCALEDLLDHGGEVLSEFHPETDVELIWDAI
jgi:hypothetical protein